MSHHLNLRSLFSVNVLKISILQLKCCLNVRKLLVICVSCNPLRQHFSRNFHPENVLIVNYVTQLQIESLQMCDELFAF